MALSYSVLLILSMTVFQTVAEFEFENNNPGHGFVHVENGGYKGILVAIDPAVEYDPDLYGNVYDYLNLASKALDKATSKHSRRYFKEATLLLPQSWPKLPQCESVTSEIQNQATFLIGPDTDQWESNPHTIRLSSQCGQPGLVTILPESFMKDLAVARRYGDDIGKTILHEWAHLRYGVFDETTEHIGGDSCIWFAGGAMYPVKCANGIQGITRQTSEGCEFIANGNQPGNVKASLMYKQYIDGVDTFCDKTNDKGTQHNDEVPNPQNDRCDGMSVWEVMRTHADFGPSETRHKRQTGIITPPVTLRCVQSRDHARMVLTMDVSSSMKTQSRILRMQQDVQVFLKSIPCRDTSIGLVEFSATNTEKILHPMASIDSAYKVQSLLNAVPSQVINRTCIGCGILEALKAIRQSGMATQGAVIVVFTDGLENDSPKIMDVAADVISAGVVVYGILLLSTAENHPLIRLAELTGGTSCVYTSDRSQRSSYYDCLESVLHHRTPMSAPVQVMSTQVTIPQDQHIVGTVLIDSPISKNALVSVTWDDYYHSACSALDVSLVSPAGKLLGPDDQNIYDRNEVLRSITIDISGHQFGKWTYIMHNRQQYGDCNVRLLIEGRQRFMNCSRLLPGDEPVVLEPHLSALKLEMDPSKPSTSNSMKLYVRLMQGSNPVVGAQVEAEIHDSSSGMEWRIALWDNGAGADYDDNDGIYSHYFIGYGQRDFRGTYSVKFEVRWREETTRLQMSTFTLGSAAPSKPQYAVKPRKSLQPVASFQRASRAIYFTIYPSPNYNPVFVPAKIADFRVSVEDRWNMVLKILWTAVGEQLDEGTASYYDIRLSKSASTLRKQFESTYIISRNTIKAKLAGEQEEHTLELAGHSEITNETTYYIAITAVNSRGHPSPVSNVQLFIFKTTPDTVIQAEPVTQENSMANWIWYIVAAGLVLILLALMIILIVVLRRRRQKKNESDSDDEEMSKEKTKLPEVGVSKKETSTGENAPDILNEIQLARANLKQQNRFKKREDGAFTIYSRDSCGGKSSKKDGNIASKSQRKNIFKSLKKSGFSFSSSKRQKIRQKKSGRKSIHKPWLAPDEPLQNHSYSNPLFGDASFVPEIVIRNSIIEVKQTK